MGTTNPLLVMKSILCPGFLFIVAGITVQEFGNAAKDLGAGVFIGGVGGYAAHELFGSQRGWTWARAKGSSLAAGLAKEAFFDFKHGLPRGNQRMFFILL